MKKGIWNMTDDDEARWDPILKWIRALLRKYKEDSKFSDFNELSAFSSSLIAFFFLNRSFLLLLLPPPPFSSPQTCNFRVEFEIMFFFGDALTQNVMKQDLYEKNEKYFFLKLKIH